ncbi:MAG: LacI family DNA-binding transcriptional regulator [Deltaproteobacteria bacterium]
MNLRELSALLGLSPTTVSRALNGYPEVNAETRKRVVAAAKECGYEPDPKARQLATGKTMAIGHVISVAERHEIVNPIFSDFLSGAGEVYTKNGYDIRITVVADDDEAGAYKTLTARGYVDGVIVHGPVPDDPRIPLLRDIGVPFVVHGRTGTCDDTFSWVDVNNRRSFDRGTSYLLELGHTRIGLLNGIETHDFAIRRRRGYEDALTRAGIAPDPTLDAAGEMTEMAGYHGACQMLESANPPSAFMSSSMVSAIGIRRAAEERGLKLGRDLSVVTFDDDLSYMRNDDGPPIFTALKSSVREAGKLCAEMLLGMIAVPGLPPASKLLESELVIGASTGPFHG